MKKQLIKFSRLSSNLRILKDKINLSVYFLSYSHKKNKQIDPYGSHIPVLITIMNNFEINHILETGSGLNSTIMLLEKYKNIITLHSIENDINWFHRMNVMTSSYFNSKLTYVNNVASYLKSNERNCKYQLVIIDDSQDFLNRLESIDACFQLDVETYLIHDYDFVPYRKRTKKNIRLSKYTFYVFIVHAFYPHTAVVTRSLEIFKKVKTFGKIYKANRNIDSSNIDFWISILIN